MSGNIDLNSEVVLAELDAEHVSGDGNETLEESERSLSGIDGKGEGLEKKNLESGERKNEGFGLEVGFASVHTGNDGEDGKFEDIEANLQVQVEGNGRTDVVGASKLVTVDAGGIYDALDSLRGRGGVDMEAKADKNHEFVSEKGGVTVEDRENEGINIDVGNKNSEGQTLGSDGDDAGESEDSDVCSGSDMESEEDVKVVKKKVKEDVAKPEFNVSDLVWGKVTSHPWWPGQILDPSNATTKAKKYFKKDKYLIGYFGDQTFAWNDASKIKPFRQHFSQMVEQSKLEDFHDAVDYALDEVSRRVEFGLGCSCMPDYNIIKTQIIVNAGIREECCRRDGGDKFSTADSFEPLKLVEYVKAIAELPSDGVDRLEFATAQSQLLAFNRWKGYLDLPQFQNLGESLENNAAEIKPSSKVKHDGGGVEENASLEVKNDGQKSTRKGKRKSPDDIPHKRKKVHEDMEGVPNKKEKSLADLLAERRTSSQHGKSKPDGKAIAMSIPSPSSKKRKAVSPISDDEEAKHGRSSPVPVDKAVKHSKNTPICDDNVAKLGESPSSEVHGNPSQPKRTFRVGDSILRVASQLSGSSGILKSVNGSSQKAVTKGTSAGKSQRKKLFLIEDSIPDDMILQLCLVAKAPLKSRDSLESIVEFFSEFRDFVCPNSVNLHESEESSMEHDSIRKETTKPEIESSRSEQAEDSSGDEAMNDGISEEQSSPGKQKEAVNSVPQTPSEDETSKDESRPAFQLSPDQNPYQQTPEAANFNDDEDNDTKPTALILNFTNLDSVPSATNLNKIFSRYGLLMESQTEVLKKSRRAKIVFHKSADAEAAFSSAGKYSIFGPSLVSYRLKYMPPKSSKSQNAKKGSKTDSPAAEGNTT